MSLIDKKKKVFGEIAAARTLIEGMPLFKLLSSFPSINNGTDPIVFLIDLIKSLIGQSNFVNKISKLLATTLDTMEQKLKVVLKKTLRGIVTCGIDPSIPAFLKNLPTSSGVVIEVSKIDFLDQFKTDPRTPIGKLLYNDVSSTLTSSSDLNTFLYGVIVDEGVEHSWPNAANGIMTFKFESIGTNGKPNNAFTIKCGPAYNTKKLNQLNDNFIDSLDLFEASNIINKIIDTMFGSISFNLGKTNKQLEMEAKINDVIDRLSNSDVNQEITDDYFAFNNEEIAQQQSVANDRKNGIIKVRTSSVTNANMPISYLQSLNNDLTAPGVTLVQKRAIINNSLNNMADNLASQIPNNQDSQTVSISFFKDLIKNIIKSITSVLLSPKIIIIFLINFKIVFGIASNFKDPIDFIKKNRALFDAVIKEITNIIIQYLMKIAMKEITRLGGDVAIIKLKEKVDTKKQQLLSLIGVPQDALRKIKGLI
jgi:hypothetical protein